MITPFRRLSRFARIAILLSVLFVSTFATVVYASHSWGGYHWTRGSNPLNLKLGDNVTSQWDGHLAMASTDWSVSSVLDTTVVTGRSKGNCRPTIGQVEICNKAYGNNGWLGIASIWVNGSHITQGTVRLNDTYFSTTTYNTPAWRQYVMCQEVGHTFGLDHQDEAFDNSNLGTCMDYTDDPDGTLYNQLDNRHPNTHDYDQLTAIYTHLDVLNTISSKRSSTPALNDDDNDTDRLNPSEWGKVVRQSSNGRSSLHEKDLGNGNKIFTFVIWAD